MPPVSSSCRYAACVSLMNTSAASVDFDAGRATTELTVNGFGGPPFEKMAGISRVIVALPSCAMSVSARAMANGIWSRSSTINRRSSVEKLSVRLTRIMRHALATRRCAPSRNSGR